MTIQDFPVSFELTKHPKIKVTPSFVIGLIDHSRRNKTTEAQVIERLNLNSASILTGDDLRKLADDEHTTDPGFLRPDESVFRDAGEEAIDLEVITSSDHLLDVAEYVLADTNSGISAYDLVIILKKFQESIDKKDKITPAQLRQVIVESSPEQDEPSAPMKSRRPSGTRVQDQVFISRNPEEDLSPMPYGRKHPEYSTLPFEDWSAPKHIPLTQEDPRLLNVRDVRPDRTDKENVERDPNLPRKRVK